MGVVVSIHIAPAASQPVVSVNAVHAVPGKGLEGDRYFNQAGALSEKHGPGREVTLIEIEALEALKRDHEIELDPADSRRNIVTRGVPLNDLVGREFRVGEVTLRGISLCEPCSHLARLTQPGVLPGLVHRGGLRAQILTDGMIRVGDVVEET
jgi:MOSC domain-containing protein YiiM